MADTIDERVAVLERGQEAIQLELTECKRNCSRWQDDWKTEFNKFQANLRSDMETVYTELRKRLPLWAQMLIALLVGVIGWFAKGQFG